MQQRFWMPSVPIYRACTLRYPMHTQSMHFRSWAHLYKQRFPWQEQAPLPDIAQSVCKGEAKIHGFIEAHTGNWAGFSMLEFLPKATLLAYLATAPQAEGKGLAKSLVRAQLKRYLTQQAPFFWLEAAPKLWRFYEKLGFYRIPIKYFIPNYHNSGTEFMGLFVCVHSSIAGVSLTELKAFIYHLMTHSYSLSLKDPRLQQQMQRLEVNQPDYFEVPHAYRY